MFGFCVRCTAAAYRHSSIWFIQICNCCQTGDKHDLKFLFSHKTSPMSTYIGIARAFDFRASFRMPFFHYDTEISFTSHSIPLATVCDQSWLCEAIFFPYKNHMVHLKDKRCNRRKKTRNNMQTRNWIGKSTNSTEFLPIECFFEIFMNSQFECCTGAAAWIWIYRLKLK